MARLAAASIVVALLAFAPSAAQAQASITGIVKDTSGAVMPGVQRLFQLSLIVEGDEDP